MRVRSGEPGRRRRLVRVTPESGGLAVRRLRGATASPGGSSGARRIARAASSLLSGRCSLMGLGDARAGDSVFDGPPTALYVPPRTTWWAEGEGEVAVCTAPAEGRLEPRLLAAPELLTRGEGTRSAGSRTS